MMLDIESIDGIVSFAVGIGNRDAAITVRTIPGEDINYHIGYDEPIGYFDVQININNRRCAFQISTLPACCGVLCLFNMHCHETLFDVFQRVINDIAEDANVGSILYTTVEHQNAEVALLKRMNFAPIGDVFMNPNTDNDITYWAKNLTQVAEIELEDRDYEEEGW